MHSDETLIIHECEKTHDELTIHAIGDAAMAGNRFAEIFDVECPLESRGEKPSKGRDQRREGRKDEDVELHRCECHAL